MHLSIYVVGADPSQHCEAAKSVCHHSRVDQVNCHCCLGTWMLPKAESESWGKSGEVLSLDPTKTMIVAPPQKIRTGSICHQMSELDWIFLPKHHLHLFGVLLFSARSPIVLHAMRSKQLRHWLWSWRAMFGSLVTLLGGPDRETRRDVVSDQWQREDCGVWFHGWFLGNRTYLMDV